MKRHYNPGLAPRQSSHSLSKGLKMPLPMKSLVEASQLLGIPEKEIRAMVDMGKVRAVMKNGVPRFAPDEIAKLARQRKTLPESAKK